MISISTNKYQAKMQMAILYFGMAEMCIGFAGVILADFVPIFDTLVVLSGLAGLLAFAFCITHPANIKTYDLLGMALAIAYGTGSLNSVVSYALDNKDLLTDLSVTEYWLTRTLGFSTAAAGFLHIVGRFDSNGYTFPKFDSIDLQSKRALWLVGITASVAVVFIATGHIGFMGGLAAVQGSVQVSPSAAIALDLMLPVGALALFLGLKDEQHNRKIIFISLALMLLFPQFGLGRRIFVFSLLIYLMAALLARRPKQILSVRNFVILAGVVMLIQVATTGFFTLRLAKIALNRENGTPSIVQLIPKAVSIYEDRDRLHLAEQIHENVSSRTFVLEYLALLSTRASQIEPTYGMDLARALVMATPSILYPSKYKNPLFEAEEDLLNPHFRLPVWDAANSVLTDSVGDFGEIGFFILPVIICFIFSMILRLTYYVAPPVAGLLVSFLICKTLLSVEDEVTAYFISFRSIFIILGISWLFFAYKSFLGRPLNASSSSVSLDTHSR